VTAILLVLAIICFVLSALGVSARGVSLTDLGLAFLAGALLVTAGGIGL
jgi:hypothetical protein